MKKIDADNLLKWIDEEIKEVNDWAIINRANLDMQSSILARYRIVKERIKSTISESKEPANPNNYPTRCYCGHTTWCECVPGKDKESQEAKVISKETYSEKKFTELDVMAGILFGFDQHKKYGFIEIPEQRDFFIGINKNMDSNEESWNEFWNFKSINGTKRTEEVYYPPIKK